jgi:hypothetical protein
MRRVSSRNGEKRNTCRVMVGKSWRKETTIESRVGE